MNWNGREGHYLPNWETQGKGQVCRVEIMISVWKFLLENFQGEVFRRQVNKWPGILQWSPRLQRDVSALAHLYRRGEASGETVMWRGSRAEPEETPRPWMRGGLGNEPGLQQFTALLLLGDTCSLCLPSLVTWYCKDCLDQGSDAWEQHVFTLTGPFCIV